MLVFSGASMIQGWSKQGPFTPIAASGSPVLCTGSKARFRLTWRWRPHSVAVCSSFVRYVADVDGTDAAACAAAFDAATVAAWRGPVELSVGSVDVVVEDIPYMHVPRDSDHLVGQFTLPV